MKELLSPQQREYAESQLEVLRRQLWNETEIVKRGIIYRRAKALKISLGAESMGR